MDEDKEVGGIDPSKEVTFVAGMRWFRPREGAPDFVKGRISIEPNILMAFLKENKPFMKKGYFGVDVKKSRAGEIYLQLDTYVPPEKEEHSLTEDEPF